MSENELDEYRKKEREEVRYLITKYFWWLVDEYGLTHLGDYAHFQNNKVWVEISLGHRTPRIFLCRVGDETTYMRDLESIIEFLDESFKWTRDTLKYTLEENVIYISDLFRRYADQLLLDLDSWWIPYQVAFYKRLKKEAEEDGSLALFLKARRYLYDYLIANGVPAEDLER